MSLCCEIGAWSVFISEFSSRGTLPVPLPTPPQSGNPPRKAQKDPVTAEVCTL
ncbi:Hypothetical protein FKW44_013708 [Caligus rogercresseyi]|uniref:Uncharacterized protein n=1 Tax=Caligus rogercresseyi TaxID=217165 RepID=A0A7T8GXZ1_CALRO|nr:Hypothetical protein FKW44_013708 [Caligus rogercresseyi]